MAALNKSIAVVESICSFPNRPGSPNKQSAVKITLYPLTTAATASPMSVLPEVGSTITYPGLINPCFSPLKLPSSYFQNRRRDPSDPRRNNLIIFNAPL